MRLAMNESTKVVAVAYANNQWERKDVVYAREQILDVMPIGVPMRAKEICEKVAELGVASVYGSPNFSISPQRVVQCYNALEPYGIMKREVIPCEPFIIMVGGREKFVDGEWKLIDQKPKTIDKVTVYTRIV